MVYGQVAIPADERMICLDRNRPIGYRVKWDNGQTWELVEKYANRLAGGYYCEANSAWFRAVEVTT